MAVLIKDPETDRLIRLLAQHTGESITEAVRQAASERLERLERRPGRVDRARLARLLGEVQALPVGDARRVPESVVADEAEGQLV